MLAVRLRPPALPMDNADRLLAPFSALLGIAEAKSGRAPRSDHVLGLSKVVRAATDLRTMGSPSHSRRSPASTSVATGIRCLGRSPILSTTRSNTPPAAASRYASFAAAHRLRLFSRAPARSSRWRTGGWRAATVTATSSCGRRNGRAGGAVTRRRLGLVAGAGGAGGRAAGERRPRRQHQAVACQDEQKLTRRPLPSRRPAI